MSNAPRKSLVFVEWIHLRVFVSHRILRRRRWRRAALRQRVIRVRNRMEAKRVAEVWHGMLVLIRRTSTLVMLRIRIRIIILAEVDLIIEVRDIHVVNPFQRRRRAFPVIDSFLFLSTSQVPWKTPPGHPLFRDKWRKWPATNSFVTTFLLFDRELFVERIGKKPSSSGQLTKGPEGSGLTFPEDPPPDDLLCPLCKQVCRDAVITPCCHFSFCDDCKTEFSRSDTKKNASFFV